MRSGKASEANVILERHQAALQSKTREMARLHCKQLKKYFKSPDDQAHAAAEESL